MPRRTRKAEQARASLIRAGLLADDGSVVGSGDPHPDAKLFAALAEAKQWRGDYSRCRSAAQVQALGRSYSDLVRTIAQYQPRTILGLEAKAAYALRSWYADKDDLRWERITATMAATLEQAMCALQDVRSSTPSPAPDAPPAPP